MAFPGDSRVNRRWHELRVLISIIVPNHGRDLSELLHSIKRSTAVPHDVFIIDRGKERSLQRNMGIAEADGNAFLILDSDHSISPGLIAECIELARAGFSCAYIPEVIIAKSVFGRIRAFERTFYTGTHIDVPRFVMKAYCPLFDTELNGPEDSDWGNRIRGIRATTKNPIYHHDDIGFWEYCRKKAYYTKSMKRYAEKWPDDPVLKFKYRCFTVFVENGKWKKIIRHPILSLGVLFVLIVRGVIYAKYR